MAKLNLGNCVAEIERRGGETLIAGRYSTERLSITDRRRVKGRVLVVLHCEGWRQYSRRFGARTARLSYLCGNDDNGIWAVRVAGTITTVEAALDAIIPSQVKKAQKAGKKVLRQGDVYVVESKRDCPSSIDSHVWYGRARVLLHEDEERPHRPLIVAFPCRMYQQRAYQMGRGAGVGGAD